jgi:Uncharacterized protein conserved in archaea
MKGHPMKSSIAEYVALRYPPLAIFFADNPPANGKEAKGSCAMIPVSQAAKGQTVYFKIGSCTCPGAGWGLALETLDADRFPGGRECYYRFLSVGNEHCEEGRRWHEQLRTHGASNMFLEEFREGEGFLKTPELTKEFTDSIPVISEKGIYIVIKPLDQMTQGETPKVVSFLVDPDQLSAMIVLANYARPGNDNVRIPFGAGCMTFGVYAFHEAEQEPSRAVVGLTDISARFYLRKILGRDILSFTVPFALYEEMESNAADSFLNRPIWKKIRNNNES